jgi:hypothetical protein
VGNHDGDPERVPPPGESSAAPSPPAVDAAPLGEVDLTVIFVTPRNKLIHGGVTTARTKKPGTDGVTMYVITDADGCWLTEPSGERPADELAWRTWDSTLLPGGELPHGNYPHVRKV